MRKIEIKNRKDTNVTDDALYELFNESFKKWAQQGLEAPWLNVSFEKFCKQLNTSTVFIAVDANTDELLGLHCFRKNKKRRWAYDFYLAVAPKAQGQGISSRMLAYEAEVIRQAGYLYLKDRRMGIVSLGIIVCRTIILRIMCSVSSWRLRSFGDRRSGLSPPECLSQPPGS